MSFASGMRQKNLSPKGESNYLNLCESQIKQLEKEEEEEGYSIHRIAIFIRIDDKT